MNITLPIPITVHYSEFPVKQLMRCPSTNSVHEHFAMQIKASDCLKNGSTKKVMNLSKQDQLTLFEALEQLDEQRFWSINRSLCIPENIQRGFLSLPVRIYDLVTGEMTQQLIAPFLENKDTTAQDMLIKWKLLTVEGKLPLLWSHGFVVPLTTSLIWLVLNASYPDNFVHLLLER